MCYNNLYILQTNVCVYWTVLLTNYVLVRVTRSKLPKEYLETLWTKGLFTSLCHISFLVSAMVVKTLAQGVFHSSGWFNAGLSRLVMDFLNPLYFKAFIVVQCFDRMKSHFVKFHIPGCSWYISCANHAIYRNAWNFFVSGRWCIQVNWNLKKEPPLHRLREVYMDFIRKCQRLKCKYINLKVFFFPPRGSTSKPVNSVPWLFPILLTAHIG